MGTKRTPTSKTGSAKKATKKRTSKAPAKKAAKKRASKAPAKKAAKKRTKVPPKSSRPTKPARPRAKKAAAKPAPGPVSAPVSAAVPVSAPEPAPASRSTSSSRPPSYLEGLPKDHAELVSGLLQVVRGAAKDLKTLVTQAVAISHHKNDRFDR